MRITMRTKAKHGKLFSILIFFLFNLVLISVLKRKEIDSEFVSQVGFW